MTPATTIKHSSRVHEISGTSECRTAAAKSAHIPPICLWSAQPESKKGA